MRVWSINNHKASILLEDFKKKNTKINIKPPLNKNIILKIISNIYFEILDKGKENKSYLNNPLHVILYEHFFK